VTRIRDVPAEVVGICHLCEHFDPTAEGRGMRCRAFPDGIPIEIRIGSVDHHRPYPGDHGIQFKQRSDR
jgi:hypothetical protein